MSLEVAGRTGYQVNFIDKDLRYIVHDELPTNMEGGAASTEAPAAIEQRLKEKGDEIPAAGLPEVRSDNGSRYVSRDVRKVLDQRGMSRNKFQPHCPEKNGIMERANRTFREALDGGNS